MVFYKCIPAKENQCNVSETARGGRDGEHDERDRASS